MATAKTQIPVQVTASIPQGGAPATAPPAQVEMAEKKDKKEKGKGMSMATHYGLFFLVMLILAFLFFYLLKPSIVMKKDQDGKPTTDVDFVRVLIGSVIVAVIVILIDWLFHAFMMKSKHE